MLRRLFASAADEPPEILMKLNRHVRVSLRGGGEFNIWSSDPDQSATSRDWFHVELITYSGHGGNSDSPAERRARSPLLSFLGLLSRFAARVLLIITQACCVVHLVPRRQSRARAACGERATHARRA